METATYSSEIVATCITVDQLIEWRYTLRMLGVPLLDNGGPLYIFGDNKAIVDSTSLPYYNLRKSHHALAYHCVREAMGSGIIQYYHINRVDNPTNVLTKFLPHTKWWPLMKPLLHWSMFDKTPEGNKE